MARHGQFSVLWAQMAERLGLEVELIDLPWGAGAPISEFARRLGADRKGEIKAVFVTHNETATGVTSDIAALRRVMNEAFHDALLFVDGVSSIGCLPFEMDEWGVDLAVTGSQKGLMMPPGLGILGVSPKAMKAAETAKMRRAYFEFSDQVKNNETGYFPYTPPMSMLRGLRVALDRMFDEGLENIFARHHFLAEGVRRAVQGWGLTLCATEPKWYSDTVSAIVVPEGHDARRVIARAYDRYGLSLGAGLSVVAGKVFRIGHLGDLNELMLMSAIAGAEMSMRDVGIPVQAGSGVAAAGEYWRTGGERAVLAAE
jgi:alanine-glyoxylate transaminase/serine-glyoxylate transaminase/serine-pyruvate transaminase